MKTLPSLLLLPAFALAVAASFAAAAEEAPIPANPGFEEGLHAWRPNETMSQVVPEAAFSGKLGLRVTDNDTINGSSLFSSRYPVQPGQQLTLTFQARADADFLAVYFWPTNDAGRPVRDPAIRGDGLPKVFVKKGDGGWKPYTLTATLPEGAAAVSIWVHSWSGSTGVADFDDFNIEGIPPGTAPLDTPEAMKAASGAAIARAAARAAADAPPAEIPPRKTPPVILLKLDDLRQTGGKVHASWTRVADYLKARDIKSSIGIIAETLAEATPEYAGWIKARRDSGLIEFWFHGWDHKVWTDDAGKKRSEFSGRPFDEQLRRFARSQELAREKLGFAFTTFGPGGGGSGGHQDAATARAMTEDPDMKVWLYPSPIDAMGREIAAAGKITVLDRVWAVNLEGAVGQPHYNRFLAGYAKNPDREYFVLQGHPTHWGGDRFKEFEKIIDFLVEQKAVFMTPLEYAQSLGGKPARQVSGGK
ncbi:polysaccharide deacetylase [Opitutaceae bacterium TAV5]|nr:polysaccharide deacetylase [Opitutaceae bacterium TAV5]